MIKVHAQQPTSNPGKTSEWYGIVQFRISQLSEYSLLEVLHSSSLLLGGLVMIEGLSAHRRVFHSAQIALEYGTVHWRGTYRRPGIQLALRGGMMVMV